MGWKIMARHNDWAAGAKISASMGRGEDAGKWRYTATICGSQNWKIYEGESTSQEILQLIIAVVRAIRDKIDAHDEAVYYLHNDFATSAEELQEFLTEIEETYQ